MSVTVTTFYKFVEIADLGRTRDDLSRRAASLGLKGTILIAREGINATIAGRDAAIRTFLSSLRDEPRFAGMASKESRAQAEPFQRLKVKIKPEIVTLRAPEADPTQRVGAYVRPEDWNALISDPGIVVVDTRNSYEVAVGTFERAIDPGTRSFSEFPDFVRAELDPERHPKVAMFCTGGIRCEKASALMLGLGFKEVYHLEGGILKYLETIPPEESLWRGECFVFDERVTLTHGVVEGTHALCARCGHPVSRDGTLPTCDSCSSRVRVQRRT